MQLSLSQLVLWLHLLGVVIWIGGLIFHILVVVPGLQRWTSNSERLRLMLSLEVRFRTVMWPVIGVVLFTGLVNVMRVFSGVAPLGTGLPAGFMQVLGGKLLLVLGMVLLQVVQQFVIQPRRFAWLGRLAPEQQEWPAELVRLQRLSLGLHCMTCALGAAALLTALLLRSL